MTIAQARLLGVCVLSAALLSSVWLACSTTIRIKGDPADYTIEVTGAAARTVAAGTAWRGPSR